MLEDGDGKVWIGGIGEGSDESVPHEESGVLGVGEEMECVVEVREGRDGGEGEESTNGYGVFG